LRFLYPALVFVIVLCLAVLLLTFLTRSRWRIERRLASLQDIKYTSLRERQLALPFHQRTIFPVLSQVSRVMEMLTPRYARSMLDRSIRDAGLEGKVPAGILLGGMGFSVVLIPAAFFLLGTVAGLGGALLIRVVLVSFALALLIPLLILHSLVQKRKSEITCALPDLLDLLVVSVEAGYGFDAALTYVVENMEGPLADEFNRALQQMRMGQLRRVIFREMAERTNVSELAMFVSSISQADQLGVSIGNVLRTQSESMRVTRRQKAQYKAMQAPIKMVFPLVFCIFPALFVVLLGPAIVNVLRSFLF